MDAFNSFYYSWSPSVADIIRGQDTLRGFTRGFISPLLGILTISSSVNDLFPFSPELSMIFTGFLASSLIGVVYLGIPLSSGLALTNRFNYGFRATLNRKSLIIGLICSSLSFTILGVIVHSTLLTMIGSAIFVLSTIAASALATCSLTTSILDFKKRRTN
jgi:hypothetical protein